MRNAPVHGHAVGGRPTPTYNAWRGMWKRCTKPTEKTWDNYGGRGIKVCERWKTFSSFLADMGVAPLGCSIGRINNDGDYAPDNCRWETPKAQARNRRTSRIISVGDFSATSAEWAEALGILRATIEWRLNYGWEPLRALTTQPRHKNV